MIGYHAVSVINEAYQKDIPGFDANEALAAMKRSATISRKDLGKYFKWGPLVTMGSFYRYAVGWDDYQQLGYIRCRLHIESVSKTQEFAYDDWCIAQMAKKLGKTEDYNFFINRAKNYRHLLDSVTGFMRPRQKNFIKPFDPYAVTLHYTEANAWQYSFACPQDLSGQMKIMGGKQKLAAKLDSLFNTTSKLRGFSEHDITGLIGQYAHGNEPSHHIIYEYNYVGEPWKAQALVRRVMNELYRAEPDGLSGNEDCGQMSAWYVLSAIGIYPVCPGADHYAIGSPIVDKAVIHFENGKSLSVIVHNNSKQNVYIASAKLNGVDYSKSYITYKDVVAGGTLEFEMGSKPNTAWGSAEKDVPVLKID
jgi:predicted alpha-1,2-mannosidase